MLPVSLRTLLAAIFLGCAVAGCAAPAALGAPATQAPPEYTLGSGDRVGISVFNEDELTGEYSVGPDGTVALPLVGNIPANGLTISQFRDTVVDRLSPEYILDPRVSVEMLNYRPFFILGEVNKPGQYPYVDRLTLAQAVATAGGYTYRANNTRAFVRRKDEAQETLYSIENGAPVWVLPGDTIRIGERYF